MAFFHIFTCEMFFLRHNVTEFMLLHIIDIDSSNGA